MLSCQLELKQAARLSATVVKSAWVGILCFQLYERMKCMSQRNDVAKAFINDVGNKERDRLCIWPSIGFLAAAEMSLQHKMSVMGEILSVDIYGDDVVALFRNRNQLHLKAYNIVDESAFITDLLLRSRDEKTGKIPTFGITFQVGDGVVVEMKDRSVLKYKRTGERSFGRSRVADHGGTTELKSATSGNVNQAERE